MRLEEDAAKSRAHDLDLDDIEDDGGEFAEDLLAEGAADLAA